MLKLSCPLQSPKLGRQVERALQIGGRTEWVVDISSEGGGTLHGYFDSHAEASRAFAELQAHVPGLPDTPDVRPLSDEDWQGSYKAHFQPTQAGRFLLVPAWTEKPLASAADAIVLRLDPGLTFGTDHPTTRLCLAALEAFATPRAKLAELRFIDVGSGSGVLGIAALLLGFGAGSAFDTDALAVARTRENAGRNGVSERLQCRECGIDRGLEATADLVFANIHHNVLVAHAERLLGAVSPGGILVLSGCLEVDRELLQSAFEAAAIREHWPLASINWKAEDGWAAIEISRRP
ncbi:MAG: 50S ribosomal protein L11 methyltransferase [Polyangiaceae bacterium]|nr:50S ribosomal protein L11 methyltransferase [Polyangiaceae bacterium]